VIYSSRRLYLVSPQNWPGELVVRAFVSAEADYLTLSRLGIDAELAFLSLSEPLGSQQNCG
jgi:hypothetical protein